MATIGLYDIDMWHRGKSAPNLELMKIYNYYHQKNQIVKMMKPGEDEGRYTNICYFKDNPRIQIPRSLILNGDKKTIYGYGFYNKYSPLALEIQDVPPAYDLYDTLSYKIKVPNSNYDTLKNSSLVRLESNDFSDYKKDKLRIFFADHNFFYQDNAYDCLLEYKQHRFHFYHSLRAKDEETFYNFERFFALINNYIIIDFRYDADFFLKNFIKENVIFPFGKRENESTLNYQIRSVKTGLLYKSRGVRQKFPYFPQPVNELDESIIKWLESASIKSFDSEYKIPKNTSPELRILLKQDPKKIGSSSLDFQDNL